MCAFTLERTHILAHCGLLIPFTVLTSPKQ